MKNLNIKESIKYKNKKKINFYLILFGFFILDLHNYMQSIHYYYQHFFSDIFIFKK